MQLDPSISAILTGIILPFVIPLILQTKWSSIVKSLVTFAIAIVLGIINALLTGQIADIPTVLAGMVVIYQALNKTGVFTAISQATDFNKTIDTVPTPPEDYQAKN